MTIHIETDDALRTAIKRLIVEARSEKDLVNARIETWIKKSNQ